MPISRKLFTGAAAVGLAVVAGLTLSAGAATGAAAGAPSDDTRVLDIHTNALTSSPELLYVPITPCRIVDTRHAVGAITSRETREYFVGGNAGFAEQGAPGGGCGIPYDAQAVAAVITAVTPTRAGYVRAWPAGTPEPGATLLNYATSNIGIGGQIKLRTAAGITTDLLLKNYGGPTHIVIDVNGYYTQQLHAYIELNGVVQDHSGRLVSGSLFDTGRYVLVWDRDVTTCSAQGTSEVWGSAVSVQLNGVVAQVQVLDSSGALVAGGANVLITC